MKIPKRKDVINKRIIFTNDALDKLEKLNKAIYKHTMDKVVRDLERAQTLESAILYHKKDVSVIIGCRNKDVEAKEKLIFEETINKIIKEIKEAGYKDVKIVEDNPFANKDHVILKLIIPLNELKLSKMYEELGKMVI